MNASRSDYSNEMQNPPAWKTALSLLLVMTTWAAGIMLAMGSGGKAQPVPWMLVASPLVAIVFTYAAVRLGGIVRLKESVAGFILFAVFAMIVLPVFQSARAASTTMRCLSNSKRLALSLIQYTNDFDDRLPPARNWSTVTYPYRKENFRCPKSQAPASYAMNEAVAGKKSTPPDAILIFECDGSYENQTGGKAEALYRHNGTGSFCFADGRAQRLNPGMAQKRIWKP